MRTICLLSLLAILLPACGAETVPPTKEEKLLAALRNGSNREKMNAAGAFAHLEGPVSTDTVKALFDALKTSPDESLQWNAASALINLSEHLSPVFDDLLLLLKSGTMRQRTYAAIILKETDSKEADALAEEFAASLKDAEAAAKADVTKIVEQLGREWLQGRFPSLLEGAGS